MRPPSHWLVTVVTGLFVSASVCQGQQAGIPLSPSAVKIRDKIQALAPGDKVTVLRKDKPPYHSDLRKVEDRSFSLYEVDEKQIVNVKYEEVKKVRHGYGGYNSISGRHVDPLHNRIAVIALAGTLVAIVLAVALAKD